MELAVGDILRIVATLLFLDGNVMQNVWNVIIGGTGGPFDPDDVADDMSDWIELMYDNLDEYQTDNCDGSQCQVYVYDVSEDDWDEVATVPFTNDPSQAADEYARGVAVLLNARTTNPDVSGKKYFGGLSEVHITDGVVGGGWITQLGLLAADWAGSFVGSASGATFDPGIWSPKNLDLFLLSGVFSVPTEPAYQRRRKRGVGS